MKISEKKALEEYPQKIGYTDMGDVDWNLPQRNAYLLGYDQAMQDFIEKACEWLEKELLVSDIEHQKYWLMTEENKSNFIEDFKNYMQNESEN